MSDRLVALERLAKLKAAGALSEAEFEAQKAELLAAADSAGDHGQRPTRVGAVRWIVIVAVIFVLGTAVAFLGRGNGIKGGTTAPVEDNANGSEAIAVADGGDINTPSVVPAGESSGWTARTQTDPMSDTTIASAEARLTGDRFDVEAKVMCKAGADSVYEFKVFDKQGDPAHVRSRILPRPPYSQISDFELRLDMAEAESVVSDEVRYSNVLTFSSQGAPLLRDMHLGDRVVQANTVMVKLALSQGDQIVTIDQTNPVVRSVIGPCAEHAAKHVAEVKQATEAACRGRVDHQKAQLAAWVAEQVRLGRDVPERLRNGDDGYDRDGNRWEDCTVAN
jgi:hypothetical protein